MAVLMRHLVLLAVIYSTSKATDLRVHRARCRIEPGSGSGAVSGIIDLTQSVSGGDTTLDLDLIDFPGDDGSKHGFHIHAVDSIAEQCVGAGGHFNPYNRNHGGKDDYVNPTGNQHSRHVGDLGNIVTSDGGTVKLTMTDGNVPLLDVIGKAIVVHAGEDDLGRVDNDGSRSTGNAGGRLGCCVIEEFVDPPIRAQCDIQPGSSDIKGTIHITQPAAGGDTVFSLDISNMESDSGSLHGFHIHSEGSVAEQCQAAGGHFNPFGKDHGNIDDFIEPTAAQLPRHLGDLGNIEAGQQGRIEATVTDRFVDLHGDNGVIGKAIVIHADPDDLGRVDDEGSRTTGNAGARLGCCVIEVPSDINAICRVQPGVGSITGDIHLTQSSIGGDTTIELDLSNFDSDVGSNHGFHIHAEGSVEDQCAGAGGHYNPFNVDHGGKSDYIQPIEDQKSRHVGDLGNVKVGAGGKIRTTMTDQYVNLKGDYSVIGKAIVVHAGEDDLGLVDNDGSRTTGNAGGRLGCCVIEIVDETNNESSSASNLYTAYMMWSVTMVLVVYHWW